MLLHENPTYHENPMHESCGGILQFNIGHDISSSVFDFKLGLTTNRQFLFHVAHGILRWREDLHVLDKRSWLEFEIPVLYDSMTEWRKTEWRKTEWRNRFFIPKTKLAKFQAVAFKSTKLAKFNCLEFKLKNSQITLKLTLKSICNAYH